MKGPHITEFKPAAVSPSRIWEIDFLRGLAVVLMVLYHFGFDLEEMCGIHSFLGIRFNLADRGIVLAQYFFAGVFVVLSGVSCSLSRNNARRAFKLIVVALVITAATYLYSPALTIHFGILHCLGVSILLYGLTLERASWAASAAAGAVVIALSLVLPLALRGTPIGFDWLLPFGITSPTYQSYDYFPLLPWFGIFLLGAALGKTVYARRRSLIPARLPQTFISWAGRHSLIIYIVHQPILLGILYALGLVKF